VRTFLGLGAAGVALSGLCGVFIGLSTYTFSYAEGASYLSDDPAACVNCHVMRDQYDGWQKSAHHANATCNDCHVPHDLVGKYTAKAVHGWRHSKAFTLGGFHEPIRITREDYTLVRDNCIRCHEAFVHHVAGVAGSVGRDDPVDCIRCHSGVGHGPTR
jgi:cytochrome c nitrite reductase small subunit